jgi:hypothetical protein
VGTSTHLRCPESYFGQRYNLIIASLAVEKKSWSFNRFSIFFLGTPVVYACGEALAGTRQGRKSKFSQPQLWSASSGISALVPHVLRSYGNLKSLIRIRWNKRRTEVDVWKGEKAISNEASWINQRQCQTEYSDLYVGSNQALVWIGPRYQSQGPTRVEFGIIRILYESLTNKDASNADRSIVIGLQTEAYLKTSLRRYCVISHSPTRWIYSHGCRLGSSEPLNNAS